MRASLLGLLVAVVAPAQWLDYPTPGVPRLANGKPNLAARAPRMPDGKPDLSGLWDADKEGGTGVSFTGAQLPPLFSNIGAALKDGLPLTPWGRDLLNARLAENSKDSPDS